MRTVAIIQARMAASRLPEKVLLDVGGRPMLEWVVERTNRAKLVSEIVVATTTDRTDDPVYGYCKRMHYRVYRGSVQDVLDRYYWAARQLQADVIVRITADCPLIDPCLIDQALRLFFSSKGLSDSQVRPGVPRFDFVANRLPQPWGRTFPIGLDIEVFTFELLAQAKNQALSKHQREHVTPFFYENASPDQLQYQVSSPTYSETVTPEGIRIALMHHRPDYGGLRWTVDTPEDLELVRKIVSHFPDDTFRWQDVLALVQNKPELTQINAQVHHKSHLDIDTRSFD